MSDTVEVRGAVDTNSSTGWVSRIFAALIVSGAITQGADRIASAIDNQPQHDHFVEQTQSAKE